MTREHCMRSKEVESPMDREECARFLSSSTCVEFSALLLQSKYIAFVGHHYNHVRSTNSKLRGVIYLVSSG